MCIYELKKTHLKFYSTVAAITPGLTHDMNSKLALYQGETASKNIFMENCKQFFQYAIFEPVSSQVLQNVNIV